MIGGVSWNWNGSPSIGLVGCNERENANHTILEVYEMHVTDLLERIEVHSNHRINVNV
jgi:hypothetical protein